MHNKPFINVYSIVIAASSIFWFLLENSLESHFDFKNSINSSLSSGLLRAKSTVASKNPNLSPTSYLLPSKL